MCDKSPLKVYISMYSPILLDERGQGGLDIRDTTQCGLHLIGTLHLFSTAVATEISLERSLVNRKGT